MQADIRPAGGTPHVVIVGGGFGGLKAARALRGAPVRVTLIDRTNHFVFQPLLYQVATGGLSADEIATPLRALLRRQRNVEVLMAEVTGVDLAARTVQLGPRSLPYDFLVVATGARYTYFGHPEWEELAPPLKSAADAARIRRMILQSLEDAELEPDPERVRRLLTFVLVGGGPTGVELAGAIAELTRVALAGEYRRIDTRTARIVLLEGAPRLLGPFPEGLARRAQAELERKGVEVRLNTPVKGIDLEGVQAGDERIETRNIFWTAGVVASPAASWLGATTDRAGRVKVMPDCSLPGNPAVFVIGDAMSLDQDGRPLPGLAEVAMQQGTYVGRLIRRRLAGEEPPPPYRYLDLGNLATVGRSFAIADLGRLRLSGFLAWLLWLAVHLVFLSSSIHNRVHVLVSWIWGYLTYERSVRLLTPRGARGVSSSPAQLPAGD